MGPRLWAQQLCGMPSHSGTASRWTTINVNPNPQNANLCLIPIHHQVSVDGLRKIRALAGLARVR